MPRRVSLIVRYEDSLHQSFIAAFLRATHLPTRGGPRYQPGQNKAGLIAGFKMQVEAMLAEGSETHLIVVMDADGQTYVQNEDRLLSTLDGELREKLLASKRWQLICPAYELENWCRYLEGSAANERRNLGFAYSQDSDSRGSARKLADHCQRNIPLSNPLPSLAETCKRWTAYRQRHNF